MSKDSFSRLHLQKNRIIAVALLFATFMLPYALAQTLVQALDLRVYSVALPLDAYIPLIPVFLIPYLGCFLHWGATFYLVARDEKCLSRFFAVVFLGAWVCFFIFVFFPTGMERPPVEDAGALAWLLKTVYSADEALNLFPSLHCFMSYLCLRSVWKQNDIARWYQFFSLALALLVFASTVFVRQHYMLDIPAGILLVEITWQMAKSKRINAPAGRLINWVYRIFRCA